MCTQELIWCSCGHGEYLPIVKCQRGAYHQYCWIIVHGDHRTILPGECSYCLAGLNEQRPLASPRPQGWLAEKIEGNARGQNAKIDPLLLQDGGVSVAATESAVKQTGSGVAGEPASESRQPASEADDMAIDDPLPEMESFDFEDVLSTDFSKDFNLSEELWQYH